MKRLLIFIVFLLMAGTGFSRHLKGGFFSYQYLSKTSTTITYHITLTVYMECNASGNQIDPELNFTFFDAVTNQRVEDVAVRISSQWQLTKDTDEECITGDQRGCYYKIVVYDLPSKTLPLRPNGYTVSYQRCCRIEGINNISNSGAIGNTYSITIPGTASGFETNSSAQFKINDTYVVCGGSPFNFTFEATDPDGDVLQYSFCDAYTGGSQNTPNPTSAAAPPYGTVPYSGSFTGSTPLGSGVSINSQTGLVQGVAPPTPGEYVVTVCVDEFRGGVKIAQTRKELHLKVGNCVPIKATLNPDYITCDGLTLTFQNNTPSSDIKTYLWDFGNGNTSTQAVATFTFPAAGDYPVKLSVNKGQLCSDEAVTIAKAYPGFFPDFSFAGVCINKPTHFLDKTTANYGTVNSWSWDFGNTASSTDSSSLQNPFYTYSSKGTYTAKLTVGSSKGCKATITKEIPIIDKPALSVKFKDTLICNGDALQLQAIGNGNFSWSPSGSDLVNANTATPTVSPSATKKYYVQLDDNGCLNNDSVRVRVVNFVTLRARTDTVICATDSVQLSGVSDGLQYTWSPSQTIDQPTKLVAKARPDVTTTYTVTARIGHCTATDDVVIRLVPYPGVNAGADTMICFNTSAQLNGSIAGSSFAWSPLNSLQNANTLSPVAYPKNTTAYILTAWDTIGCPKPSRDTVVVKVLPKINPFAGNDTAVVAGQPLQFMGSGGVAYQWSPANYLNKTNVKNPVGIYDGSLESIQYKLLVYNEAGCVDSTYIRVKVFKTAPQVFVPTAFTPNNDGLNDTFRPIAVGISTFDYFRVYNRWGQLVFSTTINEFGWDGKMGGKEQPAGTFVWLVRGTDFTGKTFFAKGTVTLIR